jgi:hypothetical protein
MSDETRPALTPEEWQGSLRMGGGERDRHALAALFLHGQPFGFTWDDVELLRIASRVADRNARQGMGDTYRPELAHGARRLEALRDRIAALLPPREP